MQNETIINFNKKKRINILKMGVFIAIIGLVSGSCLLYFQPGRGWITYGLLFLICGVAGVFMIVGIARSLKSKTQDGLILNEKGLIFRGTPIARRIGFVPWEDIQSISPGVAFGLNLTFLHFKDKNKYLQKLPNAIMQKSVEENGFAIASDELDINHVELHKLIETYFNLYKTI